MFLAALFSIVATTAATPDTSNGLVLEGRKWDGKSFLTQTIDGVVENGRVVKPAHFDTMTFKEAGLVNEDSPLGIRIRTLVEDTLAYAFGRYGGLPDFGYLSAVFEGKDKGILKGRVKVDPSGVEHVQYYWESPSDWLASLRKLCNNGNHLKVTLAVIWVYQDKHNLNRYWAVVKQGWETLDARGRRIYRDDGFLFLNFDLDAKNNPCNLSVRYRLWFYNYKHPDPRSGMKRYQLIERDIRGALDENADAKINIGRLEGDRWVLDSGKRGLSGVDRALLNRIAEDVVNGIRQAAGE